MAVENLKDYVGMWVLTGLLFFCLLTFTIIFIGNNNPDALGNQYNKFTDANTSVFNSLLVVEGDSNTFLNITKQNDPEVSDLGSRDSVASSYGIYGTSTDLLTSMKVFFSWIFIGDTGEILLVVFSGMFGLIGLYFITKWIRNGI